MLRSHMIHRWLVGACTIGILCILLGCEADVKDECGGVGGFVSCLSIESIVPQDLLGENTSNVDAFPGECAPGEFEPFGDHDAAITFANREFPAAAGDTQLDIDGSLLITIVNYSVTYTLNDCPPRASACPALTGFSVSPGQTLTIPAGGSAQSTYPFVPLRVKEEYAAEGGESGENNPDGFPFPSYTANYVFTARTDFFSHDIRIEGAAEFTIGNFSLCGGG